MGVVPFLSPGEGGVVQEVWAGPRRTLPTSPLAGSGRGSSVYAPDSSMTGWVSRPLHLHGLISGS